MIHRIALALSFYSFLLVAVRAAETPETPCPAPQVRFMLLEPNGAHAALLQDVYDHVSEYVDVYAPLDSDLLDYLARVRRLNARAKNPADWRLEVRAGPDSLRRMLKDRPGNVVVLSGPNLGRIQAIRAAVDAGLSVLADEPWIIRAEDLPLLEAVLDEADRRGLVACGLSTARFETTAMLLRELIHDKDVFGKILPGGIEDPSVMMESVDSLQITAGRASRVRPAWFFDIEKQGEGLAVAGARLIDLVQWLLFLEKGVDARKDIQILEARRWPTVISRSHFRRATGVGRFPGFLAKHVHGDSLDYFCNGGVSFVIRGVHVVVSVRGVLGALPGGGQSAVLKGSRSRIEVRQGETAGHRRELYVVPNQTKDKSRVAAALRKRLDGSYAGMVLEERDNDIRVTITDAYRVGREALYAEAAKRFLRYLRDRSAMPVWEKANMLARYSVTTKAVDLSRRGSTESPEHVAR
jgi:hypothetical protein